MSKEASEKREVDRQGAGKEEFRSDVDGPLELEGEEGRRQIMTGSEIRRVVGKEVFSMLGDRDSTIKVVIFDAGLSAVFSTSLSRRKGEEHSPVGGGEYAGSDSASSDDPNLGGGEQL